MVAVLAARGFFNRERQLAWSWTRSAGHQNSITESSPSEGVPVFAYVPSASIGAAYAPPPSGEPPFGVQPEPGSSASYAATEIGWRMDVSRFMVECVALIPQRG